MRNSGDGEINARPAPPDGHGRPTALAKRRTARVGNWRRPLLLSFLLLVAVAAALFVDLPLARWLAEDNCPRLLRRLFYVAEPFGNGIAVVLIALTVYMLDRPRRWALPRVLAMSLGAGLAANIVKMLIARVRPHSFSFQGTVWDTFGQWLPFLDAGSRWQSFPSAHTATAVGLAVALAWLYPRGRWLFAALAVLVACQRMESGVHYLSDTVCGAAIGWLVAAACLKIAWLAAPFERWERRSGTRRERSIAAPVPVSGDDSTLAATDENRQSRAA